MVVLAGCCRGIPLLEKTSAANPIGLPDTSRCVKEKTGQGFSGERMRMRFYLAIAAVWVVLGAPALSLGQGQGQCEANFQEAGNFFTGTTFSTFQDYDAPADDVFRTTLFAIASQGFHVVSQDRELRIISASQSVTGGEGSTAPLNVMIEERSAGSRARLTFTIAGGQMAMEPRRNICDLMRRFDPQ